MHVKIVPGIVPRYGSSDVCRVPRVLHVVQLT